MRSGTDLNGDNLQISRAYLRISDHCRVTVRVRVRVADCCIRTAGESDKFGSITRLKLTNAQQIRRAPHFVVSHLHSLSGLPATLWGQSMFWDDFVCMYVCMYVCTYVRTYVPVNKISAKRLRLTDWVQIFVCRDTELQMILLYFKRNWIGNNAR